MTLSSKLSTCAHQKFLTGSSCIWRLVASVGLQQAQICVMTSVVVCLALAKSFVTLLKSSCTWSWETSLYLLAVCFSAISTSSFVVSSLLIILVLSTTRFRFNPDNMMTPLAASLSDVLLIGNILGISLLLLSASSTVHVIVLVLTVALTPLWFWMSSREEDTRRASKTGWLTLTASAFMSSIAGHIVAFAAPQYPDFTAFLPIISGVGGNRAAMQCSRMSTRLHLSIPPSTLPGDYSLLHFANPFRAFFSSDYDARSAQFLLLTGTPFQLLFVLVAMLLQRGWGDSEAATQIPFSALFIFLYTLIALIHLCLLLYACQFIVFTLWRFGIDPDTYSIPILTGIGDMLGSLLLLGLFTFFARYEDHIRRGNGHVTALNSTICT